MIPENHLKIFKRYLKDKNIYSAFKRALRTSEPTNAPLKKYISETYSRADEILMRCIHWSSTKEGDMFWEDKYNEFKKLFLTGNYEFI